MYCKRTPWYTAWSTICS